jgi:tetratricopeptide (TPR) repeat protein
LGIPIGGRGKRRKRRRSYADYKPSSRKSRPRDDPFRIAFYLVLIAGCLWIYFNQDTVHGWLGDVVPEGQQTTQPPRAAAEEESAEGPGEAALSPEELARQAGEAYLAGDLDEAIDLYREASQDTPNTVEYPFQIARLLLFQSALQYGDQREATIEAAMEAANRAILANPERPEGYAIMGKVLDWSGQPEEASNQLIRAIELDETYAAGQSYLAEALVDLDRWTQARETAEEALALAPENVDVRRDYAYILENLMDYAGAATQYEAAIRIHPKLAYLYVAVGRTYRVLERYDEAFSAFFEAQTLAVDSAMVPFEIGLTYEAFIGDPNSAMEFYEQAVGLDEDYASPWLRIGTLRYYQGRYGEAIPAFERVLAQGVDSNDLYYQLGLSYANLGQCSDALPHLREAELRTEDDEELLAVIEEAIETCQTPTPTPTPTPEGPDAASTDT